MLVYQKTNPVQTAHAWPWGLRQPQANDWMPPLRAILRDTLDAWGRKPARDASRMAPHHLALEGGPDWAMDGPERRRQRPADATKPKAPDSGKQKTPTDTNLWLVNEHTGTVVSRSPTVAGHMHDKKRADEAAIMSPANATLDQDTGFPGYEPEGVLARQPKKNREARHCVPLTGSSTASSPACA